MTEQSAPSRSLAVGEFLELVREGHWEYARRTNSPGAVVIVPVTSDGCLVLIEQYRIPVHARVVELPAGLIGDSAADADETIESAARRELLEETGYEAWDLRADLGPSVGWHGFGSRHVPAGDAARAARCGRRRAVRANHGSRGAAATRRTLVRQRRDEGTLVDPKVYAGLFFAERCERTRRAGMTAGGRFARSARQILRDPVCVD